MCVNIFSAHLFIHFSCFFFRPREKEKNINKWNSIIMLECMVGRSGGGREQRAALAFLLNRNGWTSDARMLLGCFNKACYWFGICVSVVFLFCHWNAVSVREPPVRRLFFLIQTMVLKTELSMYNVEIGFYFFSHLKINKRVESNVGNERHFEYAHYPARWARAEFIQMEIVTII